MLTATSTSDWLDSAAQTAGLKRTRKGLFATAKGKADTEIRIGSEGMMTVTRPWPDTDQRELLTTQAAWCGPVKLYRVGGVVEQRVEVFFGPLMSDEKGMTLDEEELAGNETFLADVLRQVPVWTGGAAEAAGWAPPSAKTIADWLNATGRETAIDKDENIRLALKRRGCDGQIRVNREPGRLRFVMPLGEWKGLEEPAERAMLALADEANARTRLVRIAWIEEGDEQRRCEAQVDLSGLPYVEPLDTAAAATWQETIGTTIDGLELTLRRLGLELNALAANENSKLAQAFGCGW